MGKKERSLNLIDTDIINYGTVVSDTDIINYGTVVSDTDIINYGTVVSEVSSFVGNPVE